MSLDSACALVASRYLDNIRHAHDLAELYHIPLYCFWQRTYFSYPNRLNDPICTHFNQPRFGKIYPVIRDSAVHIPYLTWLGDMLYNERACLPSSMNSIIPHQYFNRRRAGENAEPVDFGR